MGINAESMAAQGGSNQVVVTAPARLHMGFVDLHGGLGRRFGSLGLTLQAPLTRLRLDRADQFESGGPDSDRALNFVHRYERCFGLPGAVRISVENAIPAHAGLGSGTQLALAVGAGLSRLFGHSMSLRDIATAMDRGTRSGIGLAAFEQGGMLVDGGRGNDDCPPPLVSRLALPERWRVLLVFDRGHRGMNGDAEQAAFESLSGFSPVIAGRLCRLVMMGVLPAVAEADIERFGQAVTEIQEMVGGYFSKVQGGVFASTLVDRAVRMLQQQGGLGGGQSSWGPTGFVFFEDVTSATRCLVDARRQWSHEPSLSFLLCEPRNCGAEILYRGTGRRVADLEGSPRPASAANQS